MLFLNQDAARWIAFFTQWPSSECTLNKYLERGPKPADQEMVKVGVGVPRTPCNATTLVYTQQQWWRHDKNVVNAKL